IIRCPVWRCLIPPDRNSRDMPDSQPSGQLFADSLEQEAASSDMTVSADQPRKDSMVLDPARLSIGKRLLSWRTIVPLVVVIVVFALVARSLSVELDPKSIATALG